MPLPSRVDRVLVGAPHSAKAQGSTSASLGCRAAALALNLRFPKFFRPGKPIPPPDRQRAHEHMARIRGVLGCGSDLTKTELRRLGATLKSFPKACLARTFGSARR